MARFGECDILLIALKQRCNDAWVHDETLLQFPYRVASWHWLSGVKYQKDEDLISVATVSHGFQSDH